MRGPPSRLVRGAPIQSLWSGYGELYRATLDGAAVVVKHIAPPEAVAHPRGWGTDVGHARKLRSYAVETAWYAEWVPTYAEALRPDGRVPACLAHGDDPSDRWLVLEDLAADGYPVRTADPDPEQVQACLRWLARFHATFLGVAPEGLWPVGTYWHLDTRPDELAAMDDDALRAAAPVLDAKLSGARFRTLVHGDAKLANFLFSADGHRAAAVDFQYVGGGCGMKDVAYFLSSLSDVDAVEADEAGHLDAYFEALRAALPAAADADAVEAEGRALYPVAWADFYRFLAGWSPGHWKIHDYSRRMTAEALKNL